MGSSSTKLDPVVISLIHGKTVLDVGCGYGRWGFLLFTNYWEAHNAERPMVDGVDAYGPSVDFCKKLPVYRNVWKHHLPKAFDKKWDVVLASEILEHLPPKDIGRALDVLEAAANKRVVITTPSFKCIRGGGITHFGFNEYEAHKSYVTASYLKKRGYKIMSVGFGNPDTLYGKIARKIFGAKPMPEDDDIYDAKTAFVVDKRNKARAAAIENAKTTPHRMPFVQRVGLYLESFARISPYFSSFIVAYKDIE